MSSIGSSSSLIVVDGLCYVSCGDCFESLLLDSANLSSKYYSYS